MELREKVAGITRAAIAPGAGPHQELYNGAGEGMSRAFELALTPGAYTALRSWAEAAPPGSTANVA